ncbi:MAG: nuclear transport factor 2 family protein [Pseudolabrys sp.]|jgi:ketosteroid isomerase-like protein
MIHAYQQVDNDRLAAYIHDDVDWLFYAPISLFPFAGVRRGKADVFRGLALMYEAFRPVRYEVDVALVDGDHSATLCDVQMEQRSTGRIISSRIANFHHFRDGLMVEYRGFTDSFDAAEQVLGREIRF